MEKYFALIKNNLVTRIIIADDDFLKLIEKEHDHIVNVTSGHRPHPGDSYYPDTKSFVSNELAYIEFDTDKNQDHLQQGTEAGFDQLKLSKYDVSCADGIVTMGCKKLSALSLLDALHKFLIEDHDRVAGFISSDEGLGHGKFFITWEDAQLLYDTLSKVKL